MSAPKTLVGDGGAVPSWGSAEGATWRRCRAFGDGPRLSAVSADECGGWDVPLVGEANGATGGRRVGGGTVPASPADGALVGSGGDWDGRRRGWGHPVCKVSIYPFGEVVEDLVVLGGFLHGENYTTSRHPWQHNKLTVRHLV